MTLSFPLDRVVSLPMSPSLTTIDCNYVAPGVACAYLRVEGDECAFIETNTSHAVPAMLEALDRAGKKPEQVRYVIITHVHLDHAAGAAGLMRACPNATLLAHPRAARHAIDPSRLVAGATEVYGAARFAELYGMVEPVPKERVRALEDGERVAFGAGELSFLHTRGHANHHFVVHDPQRDTVFTGDAFGLVYPRLQRGTRLAFPSTSPTDFDAEEALKSVLRIEELRTASVCLTHFGEHTDVAEIGRQLRRWLELSAQLMTEGRDEAFFDARLESAMNETAAEAGLTLDDEDRALLAFDRKLNAQGLAVAARRAT